MCIILYCFLLVVCHTTFDLSIVYRCHDTVQYCTRYEASYDMRSYDIQYTVFLLYLPIFLPVLLNDSPQY